MNSGLLAALGSQPLKTQRIFNNPYGSSVIIPNAGANFRVSTNNRAPNTSVFQVDNNGVTNIGNSSIAGAGTVLNLSTSYGTFTVAVIGGGNFSTAQAVSIGGTLSIGRQITFTDSILIRDSANALAQYSGTNAQAYRLYNTFTSSTNYERFTIDWQTNPNTCVIATSASSLSGVRGMDFRIGSTTLMSMSSAGNVVTVGSTAGNYLHFSSGFITGGFAGSIAGRPSLYMTGGQGSSIIATVGGIVGTDCFGVSPAGGQANTNMLGVFSSNTSYTITIGAARKDFNGAYTGGGHNTSVIGGRASSISTGGSGGTLALSGGDAAGSGNNNGGNVVITGGAATGTGTRGNVLITNLPTTSTGLPTGALWNDAGTLKIV